MSWPAYDEDARERENDLAHELGIDGDTIADAMAMDYLHDGWFNSEISPDERHDAREALFEFVDDFYDWDEFWEEWREWYDQG